MHQTRDKRRASDGSKSVLLLDRRNICRIYTSLDAIKIDASWEIEHEGEIVFAHLIDADTLTQGILFQLSSSHTKLMDRFYIPKSFDVGITKALFNTLGESYEKFATIEINTAVAEALISQVISPEDVILDFGCGSGIAATAMTNLGLPIARLIGTDVSEKMLELASHRGERVKTIDEWRYEDEMYGGAFASFVMHYGVSEGDLSIIARRLCTGARFAFNYFKSDADSQNELVQKLMNLDLHLERKLTLPALAADTNPGFLFIKT